MHGQQNVKKCSLISHNNCVVCLTAVYKFINGSVAGENEGSSFDSNHIYFRQEVNSVYTLLIDNICIKNSRNWLTHSVGTNRRETTTVYPALAVRIIHDFPELILGRVKRCVLQVSPSTVNMNWEVRENNRP